MANLAKRPDGRWRARYRDPSGAEHWGDTKLADVTHEQVAAWVAELRSTAIAASTVRQAHCVLSLVLGLAVRDGRLARNPADGVPLPRPAKGEQVFLTHGKLETLANAAGRDRLAILFLGYTGVRYGEMAALRVRNLDLLKRRALIAEAVADVNGRAVFDTPKNHQRRTVPIPRFLVDELAAHIAGKGPDHYVFTAEKGGLLHMRNFRRNSFDPGVRTTRLDGLTPHALRHTAASLAIAARRERQGGADDAGPQVSDDDARPVRAPVRRPA